MVLTHGNVIFDILEPSAFQKYSICWVFKAFSVQLFFTCILQRDQDQPMFSIMYTVSTLYTDSYLLWVSAKNVVQDETFKTDIFSSLVPNVLGVSLNVPRDSLRWNVEADS